MNKHLIIIIILFSSINNSFSQSSSWSPCGSNGGGFRSIIIDPLQNLYIAGYPVLRSSNNGTSWVSAGNGLSSAGMIGLINVNSEGYLYIGTYSQGLYRSTDQGDNWYMIDSGLTNLTSDGVAFDKDGIAYTATYDGVFKSTDKGASWNQAGLSGLHIYSIATLGKRIYAGGDKTGIRYSSNSATSWTQILNQYPDTTIQYLVVSPKGTIFTALFIGEDTVVNAIYSSNDTGKTWIVLNPDPSDETTQIIFDSIGTAYAGTSKGVFKLNYGGNTWTPVDNNGLPYFSGQQETRVYSLALNNNGGLFASTPAGVYRRSLLQYGNRTIPPDAPRNLIAIQSDTQLTLKWNQNTESDFLKYFIYMGQQNSEVLVDSTSNDKIDTTKLFLGLSPDTMYYFRVTALDSARLESFYSNEAWSSITSVLSGNLSLVPSSFYLYQNYPNPFNPTTTISFDLPIKSFVSLKVFDLLGREVATLVNQELSAGSYTRHWNAMHLSSGIYFYRLEAGSFTKTSKLVILR